MNVLEKDLSNFSGDEIISGLGYLVSTERKITHHILRFILEIENRRLYLDAGYESVYALLRDKFKNSERSALRRLNAAKLLRQHPEVSDKIRDGRLNLSQLDRVQQCLKQKAKSGAKISIEKTNEVLNQLDGMNTFQTERVLVTELNFKPQSHEKVQPQSDQSIRVEVTFTPEQFECLKRAQSLASHVVIENSYAELISYLAQKYVATKVGAPKASNSRRILDSKSGVPVADHAIVNVDISNVDISNVDVSNVDVSNVDVSPESSGATQGAGATPQSKLAVAVSRHFKHKPFRKYILRIARRRLFEAAGFCCSYVHPTTNEKCTSRFQIQVDHFVPIAMGGTNEFANLRVLCGKHNRSEAARWGLLRPESCRASHPD